MVPVVLAALVAHYTPEKNGPNIPRSMYSTLHTNHNIL